MQLDVSTQTNGIEVVCTGVSLDAREDARWGTYALKLEFVGPGGQYIGDETVSVRRGDAEILNVSCIGPWLLLQLPVGRYQEFGGIRGADRDVCGHCPRGGSRTDYSAFPRNAA